MADPPRVSDPPPSPPLASAQTAFYMNGWRLPPPTPYVDPLAGGRRDTGKIGGGILLTTLGGAGMVTGIVLLFGAIASGVQGGHGWKDLVGGGAAMLAIGGLGIGVGIPLIRSGARKVVPAPPAAHLWIAPSTLTMTF